jgi:hypothetical protein
MHGVGDDGQGLLNSESRRVFFSGLCLLCSSVALAQDADLAKKPSNPSANLISVPFQFYECRFTPGACCVSSPGREITGSDVFGK